jgi:hypothetical protein
MGQKSTPPKRGRGFLSGANHPRRIHVESKKRTADLRKQRHAQKKAALRETHGCAAAAVVGKAAKAKISPREAAVALTMLETPGTTQEEAAARARISQASVSYLVGRKRAETLTGAAGSP